jgi:hypothetical protein
MVFTVRRFAFLAGLVGSGALFAAAGAACGKDGSGGFAADTGSGGGGGDSSSTTSSAGGSTSSSSSSGVGGGAPCEGVEATISDVTTGVVGPGVKVQVTGAVAMSQKFLVSKGSSSGSCLWGVFVSAPNLTETAPNSGMLVLDYGFNAEIDDGGTDAYCPRLGIDPTGDDIPDDVKPGDVLDIVGETAKFLLDNCMTEPNGSTVGQFQLAKSCKVERTGTAAVPTAHLLNATELEDLADPGKDSFKDQWGGVKLRVENVTAVPAANGGAVGDYGVITLNEGGLEIGEKIYYRGYLKNDNFCHATPLFDTTLAFNSIEGFAYLDYCTWRLSPNDKCADFDPSSEDCNGALTCPPTN